MVPMRIIKEPAPKLAAPTRRAFIRGAGAVAAAALITSPAIIRGAAAALMRGGVTQPGGTFNDNDWPSVVNRPNLVGNVLSWVGPSGGGPNNGSPVLQSRTLSSMGSVVASTNQVIQGWLMDDLTIPNNVTGVTVKESAVVNGGFKDGTLISVGSGSGGHVFEDLYMDGSKSWLMGFNSLTPNFLWQNSTVRRCNIKGCENNISGNPTSVTIIDNWIHGAGNTLNPSYDGDLIEFYSGNLNVTRHNAFDSRDCDPGTFNSGINCTGTGGATVTNTTIDGNLFIGGGWNAFVLCLDDTSGAVTGTSATNNGFYQIGGATYRRTDATVTLSPNSGNYTAATLTATSGVLINGGTGQI